MFLSSLYTCIWRICTKYVWTNLHICLIFVYICMYCLLPLYMCIHVKQYLYIFGEIAYCLCICVYMWSIYLYILPIRVYMWSMYLYVLPIAFVYVYTCEAFVHMYTSELVRTCQKRPCGECGYIFFLLVHVCMYIYMYMCVAEIDDSLCMETAASKPTDRFFFFEKKIWYANVCVYAAEKDNSLYTHMPKETRQKPWGQQPLTIRCVLLHTHTASIPPVNSFILPSVLWKNVFTRTLTPTHTHMHTYRSHPYSLRAP